MEAKDFFQDYVSKMIDHQEKILEFLENEDEDADISDLTDYFESKNIHSNKEEIKGILHLISKISENHYRTPDSFTKTEQILKIFKEDIKSNFSNFSIFNIFKGNKRILLQLFEENILIPDELIAQVIMSRKYKERKYPHYFYTEFQSYYDNFLKRQIQNSCKEISEHNFEQFNEKRKIGENDEYICKLIREDLIDDFIVYVNKYNYKLNKKFTRSTYETSPFLMKNNPSLIEYSAFFGSIQIFRYLYMNDVDVDSNLWYYTIHGNNPDLIHFLEENRISPQDEKYEKCYKIAIKCHHIDIMNYIDNNFNQDEDLNLFSQCLKYYNFKVLNGLIDIGINNLTQFINKKIKNDDFHNVLYDFIEYDYYSCIAFILEKTKIDLNYHLIREYKI